MIDVVSASYRADLAEDGLWCPVCALPSLVLVPVHSVRLTPQGVDDLGQIDIVAVCESEDHPC